MSGPPPVLCNARALAYAIVDETVTYTERTHILWTAYCLARSRDSQFVGISGSLK